MVRIEAAAEQGCLRWRDAIVWPLLIVTVWLASPAGLSLAQYNPQQAKRFLDEENKYRAEAERLSKQGRPGRAIKMARKALEVYRRRTHKPVSNKDQRWLIDLQNAGTIKYGPLSAAQLQSAMEFEFKDKWLAAEDELHEGGKLAAKIALAKKRLESLGPDHPDAKMLRESIATSERQRKESIGKIKGLIAYRNEKYFDGDFDNAGVYAHFVVNEKTKVYGLDDLTTAVSIAEQGRIKQNAGKFFSAVGYFEKSLKCFERIYPPDHWRVSDARTTVAEAILLRRRIKDVAQRTLDSRSNSFRVAALVAAGDYYGALNITREDVSFLRFRLRGPTTYYALALTNQAEIYRELGRFSDAVPAQRQALEMIEKVFKSEHPDYISALNRLTVLYTSLGDVARATTTAQRSVELSEKVWGAKHGETAVALKHLADSLLAVGKVEEARPMLVRSLQICESDFRRYSIQWTDSLHSLAIADRQLGRLAESRRLFMHVLKNWKASGKSRRARYVEGLNALAEVNLDLGNHDEAVAQWQDAVKLAKTAYSAKHPRYARVLGNLARAHRLLGQPDKAGPLIEEALAIMREKLDTTFSVLSERQQLAMTGDAQRLLFEYLSLAAETDQPAEKVYAHVLAWKGAVLSHQQRARSSISDPKLAQVWAELQETSRRLATLALTVPNAQQQKRHAEAIAELSTKKESLEGQLAQAGQKVSGSRAITVKQLQASLPKGAALVDFVQFEHKTRSKDAKPGPLDSKLQLAAFVVRPQGAVLQIHLGSLAPIRAAGEQWRGEIIRRRGGVIRGERGLSVVSSAKKQKKRPQDDVRRLVWQPLEKHLADIKIVLVSPDGAMARLPLAALPGRAKGKYLIEEQALAIVPVPSQLPQLLAEDAVAGDTDKPSLLLVGDVDFGAAPGATQLAAADVPRPRSAARTASLKFSPLPGTAGEISAIAELHREQFSGALLTQISGAAATESRLRSIGPKHRYLHLATHGFFAPAGIRSALGGTNDDRHAASSSGRASLLGLHPGLLSGIALAGANREVSEGGSKAGESANQVADDGVLTALEVAAMNLRGVELASLSACETGLGQSAAGEGVLGLQRAFQVAGADATLTSLWKVDDTATKVLMVEFYRNLWEKKLGKLEALRQAQLTMLARYEPSQGKLRDRGLTVLGKKEPVAAVERLSPNFWAAFLLSGDWR